MTKNKTCNKCGNNLVMYYSLKCYKCYKPGPEQEVSYNLLDIRNWLEENEKEFNSDDFWSEIIENNPEMHNDSYIYIDIEEEEKENYPNICILGKHYPIDGGKYYVSW